MTRNNFHRMNNKTSLFKEKQYPYTNQLFIIGHKHIWMICFVICFEDFFCQILFSHFTYLFTFSVCLRFRLYLCKRRKRIIIGFLLKPVIYFFEDVEAVKTFYQTLILIELVRLPDCILLCVHYNFNWFIILCPPLNRMTLGHKSDNNNQMIHLINEFCVLLKFQRSSNF